MTEFAGAFAGKTHVLPVRVYFEDTDAAGIVYYANYLKFAERARTEMMRRFGIEHSRLMAGAGGVAFAVRGCQAEFLKPARLDDRLDVRTTITALSGATIRVEQIVGRPADGVVIARLDLRLACIRLSGGPARIPAGLRATLNEFLNER